MHCTPSRANTASPELHIVVPAYNEESRIEPTLVDYCEHFGKRARITVVANGCTDATPRVVAELVQRYANLELVTVPAAIGKGGAVRAGFKLATEEYVGFVDADGSTSAAEYDRLFACLTGEGACGLIASRWSRGSAVSVPQPFSRRIASRTFNLMTRVLFGLPYVDTQCGAKIFRRESIAGVLDRLELANFAFDIDLLWKLRRRGCEIVEIPTAWSDRSEGTKIDLVNASRSMLRAILRLRLQASIVGQLPYFDYFARDTIMPVVCGRSFLFLADPVRTAAEWDAAAEVGRELTARGYDVQFSGERIAGRPATIVGRILAKARLFFWYAFVSPRTYDTVVEISSGIPFMIPAFSVKTTFLVEGARLPAAARYVFDRWYRRSIRLALKSGDRTAVKSVADAIEGSRRYKTSFIRHEEGWSVDFVDAGSGERRRHAL